METITIGNIKINVIRKNIKHAHLTVHPPDGRVSIAIPTGTRQDVARLYSISKLAWIKKRQSGFIGQARESEYQYINRESHYVWGRRYLLEVIEKDGKPAVFLDHRKVTLVVRPKSSRKRKEEIMQEWQRGLLHGYIPILIEKWQKKINIRINAYFLQKMKTKWGSYNRDTGNIRLNSELIKKPKDLVEYVVVHEMLHAIEPKHNERFLELLDRFYPGWKEARKELNDLPVSYERWGE